MPETDGCLAGDGVSFDVELIIGVFSALFLAPKKYAPNATTQIMINTAQLGIDAENRSDARAAVRMYLSDSASLATEALCRGPVGGDGLETEAMLVGPTFLETFASGDFVISTVARDRSPDLM